MGEYLQLVSAHLRDEQLRELLATELGEYPGLLDQLAVMGNTISTKLATCEHVFFSFPEMKALALFIRRHAGILSYGPDHQHNATPEDILRDRSSLYLGLREVKTRSGTRTPVPAEISAKIDHGEVWRRTVRTRSRSGNVYNRRLRRDETSGVPGNPNGHRVSCPRRGIAFRAVEAGTAWDAQTNMQRTIYQCPGCRALFNLGERPTPENESLAALLMAKPVPSTSASGDATPAATGGSNDGTPEDQRQAPGQ